MKHFSFLALSSLALALSVGCSAAPGTGDRDSGPVDPVDAFVPMSDAGPGDACGNGLDDDMDMRVDEDCTCSRGDRQRCWPGDPALAGIGACGWGTQDCVESGEFGVWDRCILFGQPAEEICDGVDNDCDGELDEGCDCRTGDSEGCYTGPAGTEGVGLCAAGSRRCEATEDGSAWGACGGDVLPGAEVCDGSEDEDCDGHIDEGCTCVPGESRSCYSGPAGTAGTGECRAGVQRCEGVPSTWGGCVGESTPASEVCGSGRDEDCDGRTDCADSDCATSSACCTPFDETLAVVPAEGELLFVVDRSGSMDWPASSGVTRWQALRDAMDTVLPSLSDLQLGLLTFPEMTGDAERMNCMVASTPDIGLALGTGSSISSRLVTVDPRAGDTPTPGAFGTVQSYLTSATSPREQFVVLMTDGLPEPNCGATVPATVTAISNLRSSLGIDTFVLGIVGPDPSGDTSGIPALRDALNRFADAGGRARSGSTRYYEALDGPALTRALRAIIAAATDCHFELSSVPGRPSAIEVRQDGVRVPSSGWTLTGTRLEFTGTYCDNVQAGLVSSIRVSDSCGP